MPEIAVQPANATPEPPASANGSPVAPPSALAARWQTLKQGAAHLTEFAVTSTLIEAFLLCENTLDLRVYGLERLKEVKRGGRNPLLVIWHGQGLLPMTTFRNDRLCLYASHTRDEHYPRTLLILRYWTLRLIERMGYTVLDASQFKSESRGVMKFVDILRSGTGSVIAADGPAGPIYKAKPGPAFLAKKSGVMLVPLGAAISGGYHLDQWDKFEIPAPFAHAVLIVGEPICVPPGAKDAELEQARLALETAMNRLVEEAEARLHLRSL
jgi:lysophospholipid acyltransferase (LPLAT)-like uncharacterized protein